MLNIVRGDLTRLPETVDVIVNSADHDVQVNFGVDRAIYEAAGREKLLAARAKIGVIAVGEVGITDSYDLQDRAHKIIHAVSPIFKNGNKTEYDLLKKCYANALELARREGLKRIAIPVLGVGNNAFPIAEGLYVAIEQILRFLVIHDEYDVLLVLFDKEIFDKCRRIFKVKEYISNAAVKEIQRAEATQGAIQFRQAQSTRVFEEDRTIFLKKFADIMLEKGLSLYDDNALKRILYEGHIPQRVFYSMRNSKTYKPSKKTAIRLSIALGLTVPQAQDLLNSAGHVLYAQNGFDNEIMSLLERKLDIKTAESELEKKGLSL